MMNPAVFVTTAEDKRYMYVLDVLLYVVML